MKACIVQQKHALCSSVGDGNQNYSHADPAVCSLQHGSNLIGMTDLNVPEQLYQYMVGGHRRTHAGINREKHKSPSYQIKVESLHNHQRACIHLEIYLC